MFNKDFATFFWEYLHLYLQNSQHPKGKPDSASFILHHLRSDGITYDFYTCIYTVNNFREHSTKLPFLWEKSGGQYT